MTSISVKTPDYSLWFRLETKQKRLQESELVSRQSSISIYSRHTHTHTHIQTTAVVYSHSLVLNGREHQHYGSGQHAQRGEGYDDNVRATRHAARILRPLTAGHTLQHLLRVIEQEEVGRTIPSTQRGHT